MGWLKFFLGFGGWVWETFGCFVSDLTIFVVFGVCIVFLFLFFTS